MEELHDVYSCVLERSVFPLCWNKEVSRLILPFFFFVIVFFSSGGVGEPEDKLAAGVSALGVKIFSEDLCDRNHEQNMT